MTAPPPIGSAPLGITWASLPSLGTGAAREVAAEAADHGFTSFWAAEATGEEAFALLAHVGAGLPGFGVGTGVLPLQVRSPTLAAMGGATLQALDPDREVVLGVGISSPVVAGRWHGVSYPRHPIAVVREYIQVVRSLLSGEAVTVDGEHYRLSRSRLGVRLGDRRPKLVLGALGPRMLHLGGESADGVLLNYLPAAAVGAAVAQVRAGEKAAERAPGSCEIFAYVHTGVTDRTPEVMEAARRDLFSYAVVDSYAEAFRTAGFGEEVDAVRAAHAERNREGAVAAVSDRFVDAIDFVGDALDVSRFVRSYVDAGVTRPVLMPLPWGGDRRAVVSATIGAAAAGLASTG